MGGVPKPAGFQMIATYCSCLGKGNASRSVEKASVRHFIKLLHRIFLVVCVALALPPTAWSQQQSASLTGQVLDSSGAAIPGATVTISDLDWVIMTFVMLDSYCSYTIPELAP